MSNEYKEWEIDRAEEALDSIHEIAEIYEAWSVFKDGGAAYECWSQVIDILKKGGWI